MRHMKDLAKDKSPGKKFAYKTISVTRLGDFLDFGPLSKAFGDN